MDRRRTMRARGMVFVDLLVGAWAIVWVLIALEVAQEVRDVGRISRTVARVGDAVTETGSALEQLGSLPVLGDRIADAGRPIREAGERATRSAELSRASANDLSVLLGISIALVPNLPLLLVYLPRRIVQHRDRRAVAAVLRAGATNGTRELLARRAVAHLPFAELCAVSRHPYDDLRAGRFDALADAELRRLGLPRPAGWLAGREVGR